MCASRLIQRVLIIVSMGLPFILAEVRSYDLRENFMLRSLECLLEGRINFHINFKCYDIFTENPCSEEMSLKLTEEGFAVCEKTSWADFKCEPLKQNRSNIVELLEGADRCRCQDGWSPDPALADLEPAFAAGFTLRRVDSSNSHCYMQHTQGICEEGEVLLDQKTATEFYGTEYQFICPSGSSCIERSKCKPLIEAHESVVQHFKCSLKEEKVCCPSYVESFQKLLIFFLGRFLVPSPMLTAHCVKNPCENRFEQVPWLDGNCYNASTKLSTCSTFPVLLNETDLVFDDVTRQYIGCAESDESLITPLSVVPASFACASGMIYSKYRRKCIPKY